MPEEFNQLNLNILFNHMEDSVYLLDPESSNILWCNRSAYEELGYKKNEILNHSVLSLQKHVIGLPQWQEVAEVIRKEKSFTFLGNHQHKNGGDISVEVITTVFEHQNREYFLSVARNIGKRLKHEDDLQSRDQRIRFAFNETSDGLWEWEITTGHVFFSPQLKKILGYGPDEMLPSVETWSDNIHPDDLEGVMQSINDHLEDKYSHYEHEYRLKNRNGHYLWVHDKGKICERDEHGQPRIMVGMVHNITKLKQLENQLENLASEDFLTKLPNRRCGEIKANALIEQAIQHKQHLCLAMIDLDFFKTVNDEFGHHKGDQALEFSADILQKLMRSADLIYRWGGEEFVCLFPNTTIDEATQVTARIHKAFEEANWQELDLPKQTVSIGVSCNTESFTEDFETLFRQADYALYQAKKNGRNQTLFCEEQSF
ncbi:diguanylate cyclase [Thiomicrorhabdus sp. Kp2]|uniref:sensor domain-containing diguanylate cyclase n=1 Tax=Thiomicrorhabdus sp. Kp2 TaxID=1123518 RepID=UPI00040BFE70|nr:diguanylate cyclase [Thiomicrorhabdus sp. Kp2]